MTGPTRKSTSSMPTPASRNTLPISTTKTACSSYHAITQSSSSSRASTACVTLATSSSSTQTNTMPVSRTTLKAAKRSAVISMSPIGALERRCSPLDRSAKMYAGGRRRKSTTTERDGAGKIQTIMRGSICGIPQTCTPIRKAAEESQTRCGMSCWTSGGHMPFWSGWRYWSCI